MARHKARLIAIPVVLAIICGIGLSSRPTPLQSERVTKAELGELVAGMASLLDARDWPPITPSLVEIVHMRGSWIYGQMIAIRAHGVVVDPQLLGAIDSTARGPGRFGDLESSSRFPGWLRDASIDSDGAMAFSTALELRSIEGRALWFVRPASKELIIFVESDQDMDLPALVTTQLRSAKYSRERKLTFVGDDWREWTRVRFQCID